MLPARLRFSSCAGVYLRWQHLRTLKHLSHLQNMSSLSIWLRSFTVRTTALHSFFFVCLHPIPRICSHAAENKFTYRLYRRPPCSLTVSCLKERRSSSQILFLQYRSSHPSVRPLLSVLSSYSYHIRHPNTCGSSSSKPTRGRIFGAVRSAHRVG